MLTQFMYDSFNGEFPLMIVDFRGENCVLVISDPDIVQELYLNHSRYFDKYPRIKNSLFRLFGNGILLDRSTELQFTKRKHLSAAFYKDRMTVLFQKIISLTKTRMNEIRNEIRESPVKHKDFDLVEVVNSLFIRNI